jgi:hypothetical protein
MNLTITEGRFSEKQLLEAMSLEEYYSELQSFIRMKKQESVAHERAMNKAKAEQGRKKGKR